MPEQIARHNGIDNAEFFTADATAFMEELARDGGLGTISGQAAPLAPATTAADIGPAELVIFMDPAAGRLYAANSSVPPASCARRASYTSPATPPRKCATWKSSRNTATAPLASNRWTCSPTPPTPSASPCWNPLRRPTNSRQINPRWHLDGPRRQVEARSETKRSRGEMHCALCAS